MHRQKKNFISEFTSRKLYTNTSYWTTKKKFVERKKLSETRIAERVVEKQKVKNPYEQRRKKKQ